MPTSAFCGLNTGDLEGEVAVKSDPLSKAAHQLCIDLQGIRVPFQVKAVSDVVFKGVIRENGI